MFDWQDFQHFLVLARSGSLSAAARELGVDHATVARRVASLEGELKLKLIHRLPRSISLTQEGADLVAQAASIEGEMSRVLYYSGRLRTDHPAPVRVSASPAVASRLIAPRLIDFHRSNEGIAITLSVTSRMALLDRGEAEIAVRLGKPVENDLIARRVGDMTFGLYGPPSYQALPPSDWVFIGYDEAYEHVTQQRWLRSVLNGRKIVFRSSDLLAQLEAAGAGLGAVSLPTFMGQGDVRLVALPLELPHPSVEMWLATYPDTNRSKAVRSVMGFLANIIAETCPALR